MKKTLAIVLTLALLVTLTAPVFAAEQRSHICPRCSGTAYVEETRTTISYKTVSSCDAGVSVSHSHRVTTTRIWAICDDCGYDFPVAIISSWDDCLA